VLPLKISATKVVFPEPRSPHTTVVLIYPLV
jgi:hypothetical protein